jgi:hypothetical protein
VFGRRLASDEEEQRVLGAFARRQLSSKRVRRVPEGHLGGSWSGGPEVVMPGAALAHAYRRSIGTRSPSKAANAPRVLPAALPARGPRLGPRSRAASPLPSMFVRRARGG